MPTLADRFRRWFDYEKQMHARVLESLLATPEASRRRPEFGRALTLMAHVAQARRLWLWRMGAGPDAPAASEFFPEGLTVEDVAERLRRVHEAWTAHLARLDDAQLDRTFDYETLEGEPFRNTVADVLTQLHGHSLYHRGQVALLLRQIGVEPAVTDFVFWCREAR